MPDCFGRAGKLSVAAINTGAGWVKVNAVIGTVQSDGESALCSEGCEWAADGYCDDELDEYV